MPLSVQTSDQVGVEEPPLQVVVPTNVPQELGERLGWF